MNGDACVWGLWCSDWGDRHSKGCVFDCNYSRALSPPPESEGGDRRCVGVWLRTGWNEGWWERWSVSMWPYAAGTVGISKRNFHLGQVSTKPQDDVQRWAEWGVPTHRHRCVVGKPSGLPDSVCQKTNRKLSSYERWQKYDILISHPMIHAAGFNSGNLYILLEWKSK